MEEAAAEAVGGPEDGAEAGREVVLQEADRARATRRAGAGGSRAARQTPSTVTAMTPTRALVGSIIPA